MYWIEIEAFISSMCFSRSLNRAGRWCSASYRHSIALGYTYCLKALEPPLYSLPLFFVAPAESCFQLRIHDRILFRQYWRWRLGRGAESVTVRCAKCSSHAVFEHFCLANRSGRYRPGIHCECWWQPSVLQGGYPIWAWLFARLSSPYGGPSLISRQWLKKTLQTRTLSLGNHALASKGRCWPMESLRSRPLLFLQSPSQSSLLDFVLSSKRAKFLMDVWRKWRQLVVVTLRQFVTAMGVGCLKASKQFCKAVNSAHFWGVMHPFLWVQMGSIRSAPSLKSRSRWRLIYCWCI